jgi:hypothetical protein
MCANGPPDFFMGGDANRAADNAPAPDAARKSALADVIIAITRFRWSALHLRGMLAA